MFVIDLIERKVGDIEAKVIPLDNIFPEDLDWIKSLGGRMTQEIYSEIGHINRIRNCDSHLISIDVVRVLLIRECLLLWTVLKGNLKQHPQMNQLCKWLNETEHTHKGELMLREREVRAPVERVGPEILFGKSLEEALKTAPSGGKVIDPEPTPEHYGDSMSDEDMRNMFDRGCLDLSADPEPEKELLLAEVEIEAALEEFFSGNIKSEDLLLTEEVI